MSSSTAYSFLHVTATIDGVKIIGPWDGDDALVVTQGADAGTMLIGANGDSIFSSSADFSAQISVKLQHTSPSHRQLHQKWRQQRAGRLLGFPFTIIDRGSGEGGSADKCFIMRAPADSKGKNANVREWILVAGSWNPEVPNG